MYLTSSLEEASLYVVAFTSLTSTACLTELSIEWEWTRCLAQRTKISYRTLLKFILFIFIHQFEIVCKVIIDMSSIIVGIHDYVLTYTPALVFPKHVTRAAI